MKLGVCSLVVGGSVLALLGAWGNLRMARRAPRSTEAGMASAKTAQPRAVENYGKLPLSFEVNEGQTNGQVKFLARGQGYTLFLTSQEAVLSLQKFEGRGRQDGKLEKPGRELIADRHELFKDGAPLTKSPRSEDRGYKVQKRGEGPDAVRVTSTMLQMKLMGANATARVRGEDELPGRSNYFIGNDPKKWRTNIPTYAKVRVEGVYPGVDLVYYGNQGRLEYDFVVRPGGDASAIKLGLTTDLGVGEKSSAKLAENGDLVVETNGGEVRWHKPVIYQPASTGKIQETAERVPVVGAFTVNGQNEVAFNIGEYDKSKALVIDPVLSYSTYLGGGGYSDGFEYNQASAIAVDSAGSAYVTGFTRSPNFPTTPNSYESAMPPGCDPQFDTPCTFVYVTKFSADGSSLVYSTFIGNHASGYGIAVDGSGSAYITGSAGNGFPTTPNAFQPGNRNTASAFVTKLSPDGSALDYSTYLGGTGNGNLGDTGYGIAVDSSGNAYVTGQTYSHDFPTANPIQATNQSASGSNAFVAEINASGSALVYSTYLGGSYSNPSICCFGDAGSGIAVDASGGAYVLGSTSSTDFPTANAFQPTNHGTANAYGATINGFVAKISSGGSALVYSTYLGGSGPSGDNGTAVAVDASDNAYVTGNTSSADFPTTPNAFQTTRPNSNAYLSHAFVTKFSSDGSALIYSTYLGGSGGDGGDGLAIGGPGFAFVTGFTASSDFPTADPIQASNPGFGAFVTEFTPDGSALVYSTYLGGNCSQPSCTAGLGIAVDNSRSAYVTGFTYSDSFPTTANAFQKTNRGANNAFVAKIAEGADLDIANSAPSAAVSGSTLTYSITVTNNGPDAASNVNIQDAIPAGTNFNSVATTSGSCTAPAPGSTGTVNCTAPALASGIAITETLTVNVTAGLLSTITDTATVTSTTFDPTSNTSATATTTVVGLPTIGVLGSWIMVGNGRRTFY